MLGLYPQNDYFY